MSDDDGFERFVLEYTPTLYRTAFLLTGNRFEAEELLQDTLARLYPKWDRVMAAHNPIAYVRRSVGNRAVSRSRTPDSRAEPRWEMPERWDGSDLAETVTVSRTVWQLLGTLPLRQRAALIMRYFDDLSESEVAAALGCRPASVRSLASRGIAAMRAAYFASPATVEESR